MYLSDLKNGSAIIVDSNIFVYHFSSSSKYNSACTDFLERIEEGDIVGITSTSIVMETTHREQLGVTSSYVILPFPPDLFYSPPRPMNKMPMESN